MGVVILRIDYDQGMKNNGSKMVPHSEPLDAHTYMCGNTQVYVCVAGTLNTVSNQI